MAALSVTVPLLVVWCSAAGIAGGMVSANLEMGLAYGFFFDGLIAVCGGEPDDGAACAVEHICETAADAHCEVGVDIAFEDAV